MSSPLLGLGEFPTAGMVLGLATCWLMELLRHMSFPEVPGLDLPSTGWVKVVGVHRAGLQIVRLAETVTATRDHFGAPGKCLAV